MEFPESGELDKRITIEQRTGDRDDYGQLENTWETVAAVWAAPMSQRGVERFTESRDEISRIDSGWQIRWRSGITSAMRVSYRGTYYNIEAVIDPWQEHTRLLLYCSTGANDG